MPRVSKVCIACRGVRWKSAGKVFLEGVEMCRSCRRKHWIAPNSMHVAYAEVRFVLLLRVRLTPEQTNGARSGSAVVDSGPFADVR